mgnify:CR=1 FL=1
MVNTVRRTWVAGGIQWARWGCPGAVSARGMAFFIDEKGGIQPITYNDPGGTGLRSRFVPGRVCFGAVGTTGGADPGSLGAVHGRA